MTSTFSHEMDEDPSIAFGPLKIWVTGRQYPDMHDFWDGNWLAATARCEGNGSKIKVTGAFLHLGELKKWKQELEQFQRTLKGCVELPTIEPTLSVKIESQGSATGQLTCEVALTGDQISERHRYMFSTDQSYLPGLISQLGSVLHDYPIRDGKL